jgi:hypothetical protein
MVELENLGTIAAIFSFVRSILVGHDAALRLPTGQHLA